MSQRALGPERPLQAVAVWHESLEAFVEVNDAGCFRDGAAGAPFEAMSGGIPGVPALTAGLPGNAAASLGAASGAPIEVRSFPADGQEDWIIASATYGWGT